MRSDIIIACSGMTGDFTEGFVRLVQGEEHSSRLGQLHKLGLLHKLHNLGYLPSLEQLTQSGIFT